MKIPSLTDTIADWFIERRLARLPTGQKDNPVGSLIASMFSVGSPVYTPKSYEAMAREGFTNNGYVYRAISIIARACGGIPWLLYRDKGGASMARRARGGKVNSTEVDDHPLLTLLKAPHGDSDIIGLGGFVEQLVAYYILSGNSYVFASRPLSRPNAPPLELWALRPDRMRVVPAKSGGVATYRYFIGGKQQDFDPASILHWKTFNPIDDWYGLSPVSVAARVVDQMNAANDWNTALLQNMAKPGGFLVAPGTLGESQWERLKLEIKAKYQGAKNAGVPQLLEDGLDWKQVGLAPSDMDWLQGKRENVREIAVILGVPSELMGDSTNKTYSNYQEARKSFITETVLPLMDVLRDLLNAWLVPMFGDPSLRLDYDRDDIEALQEDRDLIWKRAHDAYGGGLLTLNESRDLLGYDATADGDVFIAPPRAMTLDQLLAGAAFPKPPNPAGIPAVAPAHAPTDAATPQLPAPSGGDGGDSGSDDPLEKAWAAYSPLPVYGPRGVPIVYAAKSLNLTTAAAKRAHWKAVESNRTRWYAAVHKQAASIFDNERLALKAALTEAKHLTPAQAAARAESLVGSFSGEWHTLITATGWAVGAAFARQTAKDLAPVLPPAASKSAAAHAHHKSGDDDWLDDDGSDDLDIGLDDAGNSSWMASVRQWLAGSSGQKVRGITDTTRQQLQDILDTGVGNGESISQLADAIDTLYLDDIIPNRSATIATTEVISASNMGSLATAQAAGVDGLQKQWIATDDDHTREAHAAADGQVVGMDESFDVGGDALQCPGDPNGSAENIINCRCTIGYVSPDDGDDEAGQDADGEDEATEEE